MTNDNKKKEEGTFKDLDTPEGKYADAVDKNKLLEEVNSNLKNQVKELKTQLRDREAQITFIQNVTAKMIDEGTKMVNAAHTNMQKSVTEILSSFGPDFVATLNNQLVQFDNTDDESRKMLQSRFRSAYNLPPPEPNVDNKNQEASQKS